MNISIGRPMRIRKSWVLNVHPMVSMISPRIMLATFPLCTHPKRSGKNMAITATRMIKGDV